MVERYLDVIRRTLELSDTTHLGLQYIDSRLNEGRFEEARDMMDEVWNSITSMKKAVLTIGGKIPQENIELLADKLEEGVNTLMNVYDTEVGVQVIEVLRGELMPTYKEWLEEIKRVLEPYVLS